MINRQGKGFKLTWDERKEKAIDVIGFLAAWGVGRDDAENIISIAYGEIKTWDASRFVDSGHELLKYMSIMQPQGIPSND